MKIDIDTLEKIAKYIQGELAGKEQAEMDKKIQDDPSFQAHYEIFHRIEKELSKSHDRHNFTESFSKLPSVEQTEIEKVFKNTQRVWLFRRLAFFASLIILLLASYWLGSKSFFLNKSKESLENQIPVAENEEEEVLLGFSGESKSIELNLKTWDVSGQEPVIKEEKKQFLILKKDITTVLPLYEIKNDNLYIMVPAITSLSKSNFERHIYTEGDLELQFLKIDSAFYQLDPSAGKRRLGEVVKKKGVLPFR